MSNDEVAGPATRSDPQRSHRPERDLGRVAAAAFVILCVLGTAWVFLELGSLLLLVFAAVVFATIFDAMARGFCRLTGLRSRSLALTVSVFGLLAVFAAAFALFGAQFSSELDTIRESIPAALERVETLLERAGLSGSPAELLEEGTEDLSNLASRLGGYAMAVTSGVTDLVLVFVGAIFIAANPSMYRRGLLLLMPRRAEGPAATFLNDASRGLRGWMLGQAVSSLLVGIFTWGGLTLLGVPASGGLAVIAGLLDIIPLVGPIIAGIPAVLLALTVSPATALWTIGLYLLIQQLQGNFLQPMIQKHAVDVPPAVLLFAVFGAGALFGALGVLLAAPLTIVIYVFVQRIYVSQILGKPIRVAGHDDDATGGTE